MNAQLTFNERVKRERERERERESEMSHFARPQNSRRVQEKARMGRPFGFTAWSNEENGDTEK